MSTLKYSRKLKQLGTKEKNTRRIVQQPVMKEIRYNKNVSRTNELGEAGRLEGWKA